MTYLGSLLPPRVFREALNSRVRLLLEPFGLIVSPHLRHTGMRGKLMNVLTFHSTVSTYFRCRFAKIGNLRQYITKIFLSFLLNNIMAFIS